MKKAKITHDQAVMRRTNGTLDLEKEKESRDNVYLTGEKDKKKVHITWLIT